MALQKVTKRGHGCDIRALQNVVRFQKTQTHSIPLDTYTRKCLKQATIVSNLRRSCAARRIQRVVIPFFVETRKGIVPTVVERSCTNFMHNFFFLCYLYISKKKLFLVQRCWKRNPSLLKHGTRAGQYKLPTRKICTQRRKYSPCSILV